MSQNIQEKFTKYEIARIVGSRALQIAMDAPILLKLSEEKLKDLNHDAIKIAELELEEDALPIAVHRPTPKRGKDRIGAVKEDSVSDEELKEKEKEVEKEIQEDAKELGFTETDESEEAIAETPSTAEEQ
ncbi:DNA-directed RNA polymerase subunit K [Candidatus Pacearchaeota archaeon]|nr:DNA-directed RNA polymerase subunit K [Candidatus Pacearchaeota archaeon]|tara:strand:+ start:14074 stop:14463 length:390 start_codon:yes stop_codon:yes gene_type:complete